LEKEKWVEGLMKGGASHNSSLKLYIRTVILVSFSEYAIANEGVFDEC
jgi:hypothetical protein